MSHSPVRRLLRRPLALSFAVTAFGLLPSAARAQESDLRDRMAVLAEGQRGRGNLVAHDLHLGPIAVGVPHVVELDLEPGVRYEWQAICSDGCRDLDLRLLDGWGEAVASDIELDPMPTVIYTSADGGSYSLEVEVINCVEDPCLMAYAGWAPDPERLGALRFSEGSLEPGDGQRNNGAFYEEVVVSARVGQILVAEMETQDFDSYLVVESPSGIQSENDDYLGSTLRSRLEVPVDEPGDWRVLATSFGPKERGSFRVGTGVFGDGVSGDHDGGEQVLLRVTGQLTEGDLLLPTGERVDVHELAVEAGMGVVVDLSSNAFDPYLIVEGPGGLVGENDDLAGQSERSSVAFQAASTGTYRVGVTSFGAGGFGAYNLVVREGQGETTKTLQSERGALDPSDKTDEEGRHLDTYTVEVQDGERLTARLVSTDFDTFLRVEGPNGFREENDDAGSTSESELLVSAGEAGLYRIIATSFGPGEMGAYELSYSVAADPDAEDKAAAPELSIGGSEGGRLEAGDGTRTSGEYRDFYTVRIPAGRTVAIEMTSSGFDGYLFVEGPNGFQAENDDWRGDLDRSRIEFKAEGTGDYLITASSLGQDGRGAYVIKVEGLPVADMSKGTR